MDESQFFIRRFEHAKILLLSEQTRIGNLTQLVKVTRIQLARIPLEFLWRRLLINWHSSASKLADTGKSRWLKAEPKATTVAGQKALVG